MKIKESMMNGVGKANHVIANIGTYLNYQILEPHYPLLGIEVTEDALYLMKLKKRFN